jgi:hypothetical protein
MKGEELQQEEVVAYLTYYPTAGSRILTSPYGLWGPPSLVCSGYRGLFLPGVKRQEREAGNSLPTNADVKQTWIYTSTPPYAFMA